MVALVNRSRLFVLAFALSQRSRSCLLACFLTLCGLSITATAQITDAYGAHAVPRPDIGHDYIHLLNETVSPANGSVNISINIPLPPGRGLTLPFSLSYNSGSVFTYHDSGEGNVGFDPDPGLDGRSHQGWEYSIPLLTYSANHKEYDQTTYPQLVVGTVDCYWSTNYMFTDPTGARHPLGLGAAESYENSVNGLCPNTSRHLSGGDFNTVAHLSCWTGQTDYCTPNQVATVDGTVYTFSTDELGGPSSHSFATTVQDRNHNTIKIDYNLHNSSTTYTDELGRPTLSLLAYMGAGLGNANPVPTFDTITVPQSSQPYFVQWGSQRLAGAYGHSQLLSPENGSLCSAAVPSITGGWPATAVDVISTITLPNKTFYTFTYDSTFGLIKRVTYPNGGYVEYDWAMQPYFNQGAFSIKIPDYIQLSGPIYDPSVDGQPLPYYVSCTYAYDSPAIIARRVSFDGTTIAQSQTFSYSPSALTAGGGMRTTTVNTVDAASGTTTSTSTTLYNYDIQQADSNDPVGFVPGYGQFLYSPPYIGPIIAQIPSSHQQDPANNPLEDSIVYEDASGSVLKTVSKTWFNVQSDIEASETSTLGASGPSTTTTYQHAWPGQTTQTAMTNYDGSQRVINVAYHSFCPYQLTDQLGQCIATGQAIFDRPDSVKITTSTSLHSPPIAETDYSNYDGNGNVQTISKQCYSSAATCTNESQTSGYDSNGQVTSVTDGRGFKTTYDYTDNYTSGGAPPSQTNAYLTKITLPNVNGMTQVHKFAYDYSSGRLNWAQDQNQESTSYIYSDPLGRLTETDYPDGGKTTINYSDSGSSPTVTVSRLDGGTSVSVMDGVGHVIQSQQAATASTPAVYVDTVYDGPGNVASVSNPHFLAASASDGTTSFSYDALGRKTYQCQPDNGGNSIPCQPANSYLAWIYSGNMTAATDESGNAWTRTTDAFGQLIKVSEPGGLQTVYGYDGLGNLGTVTQNGASGETPRVRSFLYDSLSRLTSSTNPETGMVSYKYDANSNLSTKTDARGLTTSYSYDSLNRLLSKTYSDGTPTALYGYDGSNANGTSQVYSPRFEVGRLSASSNGPRTERQYGYDEMGRLTLTTSCTLGDCSFGSGAGAWYDLAGNPTLIEHPDQFMTQQTYDGAGRLSSVAEVPSGRFQGNQPFVRSIAYNPDGSPSTMTLGNGAVQNVTKNNRLQVQEMTATSQFFAKPLLSHQYCYANGPNCLAGSSANNGNIWSIVDGLNVSKSQIFGYDSLNRITGFATNGVSQSFAIDSFGNMSPLSGSTPVSTFDPATNRVSNLPCAAYLPGFDAAGNQLCTSDQSGSMSRHTFDAENRPTTITTLNTSSPYVAYTYDGEGQRLRKQLADGTSSESITFNGQLLSEQDENGWTDYVYANGVKIARLPGSDNRLHTSGTFTSGGNELRWNVPLPTNADGSAYTVRAGDLLCFRQYNSNAVGGPIVAYWESKTSTAWRWSDTNGATLNQFTPQSVWANRCTDITMGGSTIGQQLWYLGVLTDVWTGSGTWGILYADMSIKSLDGTVIPVNLNAPSVADFQGSGWTTAPVAFAESVPAEVDPTGMSGASTHYYLGDHLGTAQLEFASGGWPLWQGQFSPFGQELNNQPTTNKFKFTGKERDTESGLDYFGARYYASSMGRFMSPDSPGFAHLSNPQAWNLYSYTYNNPISSIDPDGHDVACANNTAQCVADANAATNGSGRVTSTTTTTDHSFLGFHWSTSETKLAISGNEASFRALGQNASRLTDLIDNHNFTLSVSYGPYANSGGAGSYLPSQGYKPSSLIDPTRPGGRYDTDALDQHLPQATTAEEFGHEVLGHDWGELIGGHPVGSSVFSPGGGFAPTTRANMRDSITGENAVRALDPTRGQKAINSHHSYYEAPADGYKKP